jgi:hypothetical protein
MLRFFASVASRDVGQPDTDNIANLCNRCVEMARHNLNILVSLWEMERIGNIYKCSK